MKQSLGITSSLNINRINVEQYNGLKLKDGRIAANLPVEELRRELLKLGVPDVSQTEGVQSMLPKFAKWLESRTVVLWPETEGEAAA